MASSTRYSCAVVTPVGPGHKDLFQECKNSVLASFDHSPGIFSELSIISVDDLQGIYGRSRARNSGVKAAFEKRADWLFFLDADDLMAPYSFELVSPYLLKYDAIWGRIDSFYKGEMAVPRQDQVMELGGVIDLLTADPFLTLQMGHFVRTRVAYKTPFDPLLDAGEDFDYYLRVWAKHQCLKIPYPLFFNRRGSHSTGPRSADGAQWRRMVHERFRHYALKWGLLPQEEQMPQAESA